MSAARRDAGVKQRSMAGILARDHFAWVERVAQSVADVVDGEHGQEDRGAREERPVRREVQVVLGVEEDASPRGNVDRKSTRLNSSHTVISYAVFCLKKKNKMVLSYSLSCTP